MSVFRECVRTVTDHMGMDCPDSYIADIEMLNEACADWHRERAPKMGFIKLVLPDLTRSTMVTGNLDQAIPAGWCGNEAARDLIRYIDDKTAHRCTLLMLQILVLIQTAIKEPGTFVNASGGHA